jgi:uncharacterized repeat protein (TIGR01451 family)
VVGPRRASRRAAVPFPKSTLAREIGRLAILAALAATSPLALANTSQLVFTNPAVLSGLQVPANSYPVFVDIDGDGRADAFVGAADGTIRFFRNVGTPARPVFQEQTGPANPLNGVTAGTYSAPAFVDIDGDGDLDAFIGAHDGTIRFFRNTGSAANPVFVEQTGANNPFNGVRVGGSCCGRSAPTFVDIDGDGDYDAFVGDFYGTISYFANTGSATDPIFTQRTGTANPLGSVNVGYYSAPTFADIDGDGDYDAFIGTKYGTVLYFENTGTASAPVFTPRTGAANPADAVHVPNDAVPVVADVNADGVPDLVVGGESGDVRIFPRVRTATGLTFVDPNPLGVAYSIYDATAAFADLDGDGDFDAVVGASNGTVHYFQNTGTARAPDFVERTGTANPFNGVNVGAYSVPAIADVNGDGLPDVVLGAADGTLHFLANTGTKTTPAFTELTGAANPFNGISITAYSTPCLADLDGNGRPDLVLGAADGTLRYFRNTGTATNPTFTAVTGAADPFNGINVGSNSRPFLVDINHDGTLDLFVGAGDGSIHLFENVGTATNPSFVERTGAADPFTGISVGPDTSPAFVDIDGDGDADAFIGTSYQTGLTYFRNDTPQADLSITQVASPEPVLVGGALTYTLTLSNAGPNPATGTVLTDTLPAAVTLVSTSAGGGTCTTAAGAVRCTLGTLAKGGSDSVTMVVTPTTPTTLRNAAVVVTQEFDPNASNNWTAITTVAKPSADLAIALTGAPDPVLAGGQVVYTATVVNHGPSPATNVTVVDLLPAGLRFASARTTQGVCSESSGTVTCSLGTLTRPATAQVWIAATVEAASLANDVASVAAAETDPVPANNRAASDSTVSVRASSTGGGAMGPLDAALWLASWWFGKRRRRSRRAGTRQQ